MMNYLTLAILVSALSLSKPCEVLRNTKYGPICGTIKNTRAANSSVQYLYFTGVPYARPPIGSLRFKEPQPPIPWLAPKNATVQGNICVQINNLFMGDTVIGNEDCLTLEVSAPIQSTTEKLPVMVWFHGGSFLFSSYRETGPDYLMQEPVVLVSINYRLNVLGFLSTLNNDAPGNMGLKDQTAALIWVKNNIEAFGGDSHRVTIFGGSAGGASVQFHMLSPRTKGLFHRAISQSGVTINTWVFQRNPLEMAYRLARSLGINTANTTELVEELRQVSVEKLLKNGFNPDIVGSYILFDEVPFIPSIEHDHPKAFISSYAYEMLLKGQFNKVPYMIGHVSEEGSFPYGYVSEGYINLSIYEKDPSLFIPISMNLPKQSPCVNSTVEDITRNFFLNTQYTDRASWIKAIGQDVRGIRKSAELICQNQNQNVFFYVYSYVGSNNLSYEGGAGHYSEVLKLFYPVKDEWTTELTKTDIIVQNTLLKLWTTFARTGNPTPNGEWPSFCNRKEYLNINEELEININPDCDVYYFWENAFSRCGRRPYNTY